MIPLKHAILKLPAVNFAQGLTTSSLGIPDHSLALAQHHAYQAALERCGLSLRIEPADPAYPDSTFVEDTAVLIPECAIVTRPGAPSRSGEILSMQSILAEFFQEIRTVASPGTLDGGDVCDADGHFFIGISNRTNEEGARQLASILEGHGYTATLIEISGLSDLLHLKSGLAYLGGELLVLDPVLADLPAFSHYRRVVVEEAERYAANCIRVNDFVLVAEGFPRLAETLLGEGCQLIPLAMTEFRKMDGGLSCLSLRF